LKSDPIGVPEEGTGKFDEMMRALVDLIEDLDEPAVAGGPSAAPIAALKKRASDLLTRITAKQKAPRQTDLGHPRGWLAALGLMTPAYAEPSEERFRRHGPSYLNLFETCQPRPL
jgi:hypothetical protein